MLLCYDSGEEEELVMEMEVLCIDGGNTLRKERVREMKKKYLGVNGR
jgi:hypothetical protein